MKVKVNDNVMVVSGKDRGKTGKVLSVFPEQGKLSVAGVSLIKRHVRKSKKFPQGGRVELPAKVDSSNVMVICPNCKKKTRVGFHTDKNVKERICKKCGKSLDIKEKK